MKGFALLFVAVVVSSTTGSSPPARDVEPAEIENPLPDDDQPSVVPDVPPAPVMEEIGVFETKYATGANRGHNVERAASFFAEGVTLAPGETLSFNAIVGPRDQKHGFWKAPVIVDGEMTDGDGGGVCQVSSTLHAAARMARLTIEVRTPHTRPSAYIATGFDATVVYPTKDLKIRNDGTSDVVITISTHRDPKNKWLGVLTAEVMGTKTASDGTPTYTFKVGMSGQSFSRRSKEKDDCTDCPKKVQKGADGTIVWSTLTFGDGTKDTWRSAYPATDEIWEVAPGQTAPEVP